MKNYLLLISLISVQAFSQERSFTPAGSTAIEEEIKVQEKAPEAPVVEAPKIIEAPSQPDSGNSSKWRFAVGLGSSTNIKQTFDKVKVSDNSGFDTGTITYEWQSTPEITLSLIKSVSNSWGKSVNFTYVTQQKLTGASYTIDGGGGGTLVITDPAKSESYILDSSWFYRWNSFYLPFGFNYSVHKYTLPTSSTGYSVDVTGGLGAQLGIGFFLGNKFSIEVKSRALNYNLSFKNPSANNYKGDFGSSYLSSLHLTLKFITD